MTLMHLIKCIKCKLRQFKTQIKYFSGFPDVWNDWLIKPKKNIYETPFN